MIPMGSGITTTGPPPVARSLVRTCVVSVTVLPSCVRAACHVEVAMRPRLDERVVDAGRDDAEALVEVRAGTRALADVDPGGDAVALAGLPDRLDRRGVTLGLRRRPRRPVRRHPERDREVARPDVDA